MNQKRIKFVIVYFGALPFWLPAFLRSCQLNHEVEWVIFTDAVIPNSVPANVQFEKMDLLSFNDLCSRKMGIKINVLPSFLYKLTDFKPVYGKIFEDYLKGYEFWGHCDIDVVWGDIRKFFTDDILANYDIITSRPMKISGHCCLYRNNAELKNLYQGIPNVLSMLRDSENHFSVGEKKLNPYLRSLLYPPPLKKLGRFLSRNKSPIPKIFWENHLTTPGRQQKAMAAKGKFFRWSKGKVFDENNNELMYIHFHKIRKYMHTIDFTYEDQINEFIITQNGFFRHKIVSKND